MSEPARITQQEVQPLPRWARLAFAARCLRRALPLLHAPPDQVLGVLRSALERIERAAGTASADDDLADAAAAAYTLALDNADSKDPSPAAENHTIVTCMVAHATAFAAEAGTLADARRAGQLVAQSVDFAIHAFRLAHAPNAEPAITAMRGDLQRFVETAEQEKWDDQMAVPPARFGPL